ncbi:MAG: branched-chain amino acid ABC transporter permease [Nocardioidaceae bacterium]
MDWLAIMHNSLRSAFGPDAVVYAMAAIGLNVHFGYTGLLNFGQAGFMLVASYGLAASVTTWGLPFWLGLIIGLLASVVLALLLGIPTLRLRADYLAIVTIAAAEILRILVGSVTLHDQFGGRDGLQQFMGSFFSLNPYHSTINLGLFSLRPTDAWTVTVGWILVALACVMVWLLMRSPWGRVLKSIREDEDAVRSLGKNVYAYKMQSLILGGLFGALAGFLLCARQAAINPDNFATDTTFFAYTVLLIGGAARVLGPVVGAIIFWFLISFATNFFTQATAGNGPLIPSWVMTSIQAGVMQFILVGAALMLLMVYRPQGIFGDRKELALDER